jgi:hypothetical protein
MKKKKLAKKALEHPELFAPAELMYFERWLHYKKQQKKTAKIEESNEENS